MKYLAIVLWLALGVGYYFGWDAIQQQKDKPIAEPAPIKTEFSTDREEISFSDEAKKAIEEAAVKATESEEIIVVEEYQIGFLYFPYNSDKPVFSSNSETYLKNKVEQALEANRKIIVTGHADNIGETDYNYNLGLRRAEEIRNKLVSFGFSSQDIIVSSKGEDQPVASNDTEEGRSANRRVEIYLQ